LKSVFFSIYLQEAERLRRKREKLQEREERRAEQIVSSNSLI